MRNLESVAGIWTVRQFDVHRQVPITTFPMVLLALPDGDFVVAGTVDNCAGPGGSLPGGLNSSGWLARYGSGCKP